MDISNNKILIAGGASGIGRGLTERFIDEKNTVIICGRREDALSEIKNIFPNVITRRCDLSKSNEREGLLAIYEYWNACYPNYHFWRYSIFCSKKKIHFNC